MPLNSFRISWRIIAGDNLITTPPVSESAQLRPLLGAEMKSRWPCTNIFLPRFSSIRPAAVKVQKAEYTAPDGKAVPTLDVTVSEPGDKPVRVYVGPKQKDSLAKADPGLASMELLSLW
jgi:hypothetical protein